MESTEHPSEEREPFHSPSRHGRDDHVEYLEERLRSLRDALRAARQGDFTVRLPADGAEDGMLGEVSLAFNALVEQHEALVREVGRVARVVGVEGKTSERASLGPVDGSWACAIDSINLLSGRVAWWIYEASRILGAVSAGDLSQTVPHHIGESPWQGDFARLTTNINDTVAMLRRVTSGVSWAIRQVTVDGRLGARIELDGMTGAWKELIGDVNLLATNLSGQVRDIAQVSTAIANGDLSQRITVETRGELLELKNAINATVDQLRAFSAEVLRVAREVGTEGKLGAQADVRGVSGVWQELTNSVNRLAGNLTSQVRNIAAIATAIANGDLSQKITVEAKGEILELKNTVNVMVDQLRAFAAEVTRVAREVGTEGRLGAQADVKGVSGTWKGLTDNVNLLAGNLTDQVRNIALVTTAIANGDLSKKITVEARGEILELKNTINTMVDRLETIAAEVTRVAKEVGTEGALGGQADVKGVSGTWKDLTDNVNVMASNLTGQVRGIAKVVTAVATGDLSQKFVVEAKGEIAALADTINNMTEQLRTLAAEVTRVAREVATEGQLGGQASVPGVSGTWKDLTDSVNLMASNLTDQVRGIGKIVTAVANGELTKKLQLVAKGEIATLAETINNMTDTLRTFAEQVTTVAREVGIEGQLGGQAKVPGAAGTWRDLTDNVNQLAANLTTQVRAIFEVATAVIQGDLTRSITVAARGEVLGLKDTINQMIANLRDTTRTNKEQDWLKTNLARFFGLMQGQRDLKSLTDQIMAELTPVVGAQHGAFYLAEPVEQDVVLKLTSTYAYSRRKHLANRFQLGEGLVGQCALERKSICVTEVPDDYIHIESGLGHAPPRNIAVIPVTFENQVRGVIELASFLEFTPVQLTFLEQLTLNVGLAMNLIGSSMRTEQLLQQLQTSNVELERRRKELEDRAELLEVRNREIAQASASLESKSQELARVSRYKSQFLTNMSHEIRTPLNSMLILAQMLAANEDKTLLPRQQEWAQTIHAAGRDLLALINQILDLSKVEAGRIETSIESYPLRELRDFVERTFRPVALQRNLELSIDLGKDIPESISTDRQLLDQVMKNLLANAFKFTEHGGVDLRIELAPPGVSFRSESLRHAPAVLAFAVSDTGIGIAAERHDSIFEAFQQADMSIVRKYGGTGLGLTISREYAHLLGGEIALSSIPDVGSTFTLYLPISSTPVIRAPSAPMEERAPPVALTPELTSSLSGRSVLIVEDDVRNLYATTALLERYGMTVIPASSARGAFAALHDHPETDLVLMDVMMPEMDGYQATREIRTMKGYADLPVIALTAKASDADRSRAREAGCSDFVVKPVETPALLSVIAKHLRTRP